MDVASFQLLKWLEMLQGTLLNPLSVSFLLFFFLLFWLRRNSDSQKPNLPPSPPKLPIIGNFHLLGLSSHIDLRDLARKYGPIMLVHYGSVPHVVVSTRDMAREILKINDTITANKPFTTAAKVLFYGWSDIAFSPYGEYWRQTRKICVMKLLSVKKVQAFKFVREEELTDMAEEISQSCASRTPVNMSEFVLRHSKRVISRCGLGIKYGADSDKRMRAALKNMGLLLGEFCFQDYFPWMGWMDYVTGYVRRLNKCYHELDTFLDEVIDEHLVQKERVDEGKEPDFLDLLLQDHGDLKLDVNLTKANIKALILDMFIAGIDTTSATIDWAMTELIKHPHVMKKAQEEMRRVVGVKKIVEDEDIRQMDYFMCIIKETLRLHPPGPLLLPRVPSANIKVAGYDIPERTSILINAWAIHRDPATWEEPESFIPERFISKPLDFEGQSFEYMPFGAGRRSCPGLPFGLSVVQSTVANLIYWFDWELPPGVEKESLDESIGHGLAITKGQPLYVIPVKRFT